MFYANIFCPDIDTECCHWNIYERKYYFPCKNNVKICKCFIRSLTNMHVAKHADRSTSRKLRPIFFHHIWARNRNLNNCFKDVTKPYNRKYMYPKMCLQRQ